MAPPAVGRETPPVLPSAPLQPPSPQTTTRSSCFKAPSNSSSSSSRCKGTILRVRSLYGRRRLLRRRPLLSNQGGRFRNCKGGRDGIWQYIRCSRGGRRFRLGVVVVRCSRRRGRWRFRRWRRLRVVVVVRTRAGLFLWPSQGLPLRRRRGARGDSYLRRQRPQATRRHAAAFRGQ